MTEPPVAGPSAAPQGYPLYPTQPSEGRPVSFYLAIFLAMLLVLSVGLNVVLLVVGVVRSAAGGLGDLSDSSFEVVTVGGDRAARDRILRLPIEGAIAESATPLIGAAGGSVTRVERALRLARRDESIKGVLLFVNSPGGGVTDSDQIYREIRRFRSDTHKPVVALFGDMAASGGYYVACACEHILAQPTTITGSIGVILSQWNFAEAAKKVGVQQVDIVSERTPYKAMLSPAKPVDENEVAIARSIVDEMYDRFVDVVTEGRDALDRGRVEALADGRIYSASQARAAGLVDGIGTEEDAIALLKTRAKIDEAKIVEQRRRLGFFDLLTGARAPATPPTLDRALAALLQGSTGPRLLYFWPGGR
ncbi:MAG: signal peptide peptidase SppA [Planctomycetota bacterium]